MKNKSGVVVGAIFIILGLMFLFANLHILSFSIFNIGYVFGYFWATIFMIVPAVAMHSIYFSGKSKGAGILVPAGIFLVDGVVCQLSMLFNLWGVLWPGFIFATAFGLFELYLFGDRRKGLLIPVAILGGMSLIFFEAFSLNSIFGSGIRHALLPIIIVLIGLIIIFSGRREKRNF